MVHKVYKTEKLTVKCSGCGYNIDVILPKLDIRALESIDIYCMFCGVHSVYTVIQNSDKIELAEVPV